MTVLPTIYTEVTKEDDPIGGVWSAKPFAMQHVEWVPAEDHTRIVAALKTMIRVNALRCEPEISHAEIDAAIDRAISRALEPYPTP